MPEKCPRCGTRNLQPPPELGGMYVCSYCGLRTYSRYADEAQHEEHIGVEDVGRLQTLQKMPKFTATRNLGPIPGILILALGLAVYFVIPFDPNMIVILLFVLTV